MMFILLDAAHADQVRGAYLVPRQLTDGTFVVNTNVLADPLHSAVIPVLAGLTQASLETITPLLPVDT
jgi:hypothetical protein